METNSRIVSVAPTVTAGAYSANDAVGGILTFPVFRENRKTGVILSVTIMDRASQEVSMDLVLFNQSFTAVADNAAFDVTDADLLNCLGVIPILSTDYATFADNSIATVRNVGLAIETKEVDSTTAETNIYGQLVTRGTPTYAATTDVQVSIGVLQD